MSKNSIDSKEGLVFAMPLGNGQFGLGQIIASEPKIFFMVGFGLALPDLSVSVDDVATAPIVAMGNFFDVLIRKGRWLPVGVMPVRGVRLPHYKVMVDGAFNVESWDRTQARLANDAELDMLQFRSNHGPIILENAVRHKLGLYPHEKLFDQLEPASAEAESG